ncbi:type II secretion system F family protein [Paenibacillus sp. OV219]|uniref:type II secretion system F family protein n=1 Tax=Paenibacillus sp. OV219 TaxID=1884377 RepID=UPI0008D5ADE8|nr:type II secretion system F family protein [Paenibacillus sp. OV219]SEN85884.1 tight adherence protein C [Paenibacillus sp. OV219]
MVLSNVIGCVLSIAWLAVVIYCDRQGNGGGGCRSKEPIDRLVRAPFLFLLQRSGILDRMGPLTASLHSKLFILHGSSWSLHSTNSYIAVVAAAGYGAVCGAAWLSALSGEQALLYIGLLLGIVIPAAKWRDATTKVEKRRQDMLLLLPEVMSKLMLLIGAGENIQRALLRCAERRDEKANQPLLIELRKVNEAVRNGESFAAALELLSRRCAVQEVSLFTTTLLLNYRRGGDKLALSLKELSYSIWEKRKAVARARGEEASSKLVFPLVGIFFILMTLVASPAILLIR